MSSTAFNRQVLQHDKLRRENRRLREDVKLVILEAVAADVRGNTGGLGG
jgi:hypothetical protein